MSKKKTHVQIGRNADGGHALTVDGVDMSAKVLARGFSVEFATDPAMPDLVHMIVAADVLEIDLPAAMLSVARAEVENA